MEKIPQAMQHIELTLEQRFLSLNFSKLRHFIANGPFASEIERFVKHAVQKLKEFGAENTYPYGTWFNNWKNLIKKVSFSDFDIYVAFYQLVEIFKLNNQYPEIETFLQVAINTRYPDRALNDGISIAIQEKHFKSIFEYGGYSCGKVIEDRRLNGEKTTFEYIKRNALREIFNLKWTFTKQGTFEYIFESSVPGTLSYYLITFLQEVRNKKLHEGFSTPGYNFEAIIFHLFSYITLFLLINKEKGNNIDINNPNLRVQVEFKGLKKEITLNSSLGEIIKLKPVNGVVETTLLPFVQYSSKEYLTPFQLDEFGVGATIYPPSNISDTQFRIAFEKSLISDIEPKISEFENVATMLKKDIRQIFSEEKKAQTSVIIEQVSKFGEIISTLQATADQIDDIEKTNAELEKRLGTIQKRLSSIEQNLNYVSQQVDSVENDLMFVGIDITNIKENTDDLLESNRKAARRHKMKCGVLIGLLCMLMLAGGVWLFGRYYAAEKGFYGLATLCGDIDAPYYQAVSEEAKAVEMMHESSRWGKEYFYELDSVMRKQVRRTAELYRKAIANYESAAENGTISDDQLVRLVEMLADHNDYKAAIHYAEKLPNDKNKGILALLYSYNMATADNGREIAWIVQDNSWDKDSYFKLYEAINSLYDRATSQRAISVLDSLGNNENKFIANRAKFHLASAYLNGYMGTDGKPTANIAKGYNALMEGAKNMYLKSAEAFYAVNKNILTGPSAIDAMTLNVMLLNWDLDNHDDLRLKHYIESGLLGKYDKSLADEVRNELDNADNYAARVHRTEILSNHGRNDRAIEEMDKMVQDADINKESFFRKNISGFLSNYLRKGGADALANAPFMGVDSADMPILKIFLEGMDAYRGYTVPKDTVAGAAKIKEAADSGLYIANICYANMLLNEHQSKYGQPKAFQPIVKIQDIEQGQSVVHRISHERLLWGNDINKNQDLLKQAKSYLEQVGEDGDVCGMLSYIYSGLGDTAAADKYHKKALEQYNLASVLYEVTKHVPTEQTDAEISADIRLLEGALALNKDFCDQATIVSALANLAMRHYFMGNDDWLTYLGLYDLAYKTRAQDVDNIVERANLFNIIKNTTDDDKALSVYAFANYAISAFQAIKLGNTVYDPSLIYNEMAIVYPEAEEYIMATFDYDPFSTLRGKKPEPKFQDVYYRTVSNRAYPLLRYNFYML